MTKNKINYAADVTPIIDTLWMRCFWECHEKAINTNSDIVDFNDVDALVIIKSKLDIDDLLKFISGNGI